MSSVHPRSSGADSLRRASGACPTSSAVLAAVPLRYGPRTCSPSSPLKSCRTYGAVPTLSRRPSVETTWDAYPISNELPFGATVVVYRVRDDGFEVLMLYRAHHGPAYTGNWAWRRQPAHGCLASRPKTAPTVSFGRRRSSSSHWN
jgi:hypothetical protein